jgi:hypothetical protein
MNKWNSLKSLIQAKLSNRVHYSFDRAYEQDQLYWVMEEMKALEENERKQEVAEALNIINKPHGDFSEGFLYTGIPIFDQKTWERILEEKGLQGLS